MLWVFGIFEFVFGLGLLVGIYIQIIALGIILFSIAAIFGKNTALWFGSNRLVYLFMLGVSLSLLLSGAGALAFDLPL